MKILILGQGKEGQAVKKYFSDLDYDVTFLDNFTTDSLKKYNFSSYDMVFRSPSVYPVDKNWSSSTKYFFDNCICKIIGVTGTKGKGTTCTIITHILETLGKKVHLVGNIGNPAISELEKIQPDDVVVYEMSSFQLWDLAVSPHISVVLRIEPDHLNVHDDYADYLDAKSHIAKYQKPEDYCVYFDKNSDSRKISDTSSAHKLPYPVENNQKLNDILDSLSLAGAHNRENASAAILACSAYFDLSLDDFLTKYQEELKNALSTVKGLPHRMEYLREFEGIRFYDDNFSTTIPSLEVALNSFSENTVLIMGGRDKTNYTDLPEIKKILDSSSHIKSIVLIGESGHKLYTDYPDSRFVLAESLEEAVSVAMKSARATDSHIILMSPAAASFDMFENVYDRGAKYQQLIKSL